MLPQKRIRKISGQYIVYGVKFLLTSSPPPVSRGSRIRLPRF